MKSARVPSWPHVLSYCTLCCRTFLVNCTVIILYHTTTTVYGTTIRFEGQIDCTASTETAIKVGRQIFDKLKKGFHSNTRAHAFIRYVNFNSIDLKWHITTYKLMLSYPALSVNIPVSFLEYTTYSSRTVVSPMTTKIIGGTEREVIHKFLL